jgi:hypothetical protein
VSRAPAGSLGRRRCRRRRRPVAPLPQPYLSRQLPPKQDLASSSSSGGAPSSSAPPPSAEAAAAAAGAASAAAAAAAAADQSKQRAAAEQQQQQQQQQQSRSQPVPWGAFLSSAPVWAVTVAHFCFNWGYYTLLAWLPSYFELALGLNVQESSFLTLIPYGARTPGRPGGAGQESRGGGGQETLRGRLAPCGGSPGPSASSLSPVRLPLTARPRAPPPAQSRWC